MMNLKRNSGARLRLGGLSDLGVAENPPHPRRAAPLVARLAGLLVAVGFAACSTTPDYVYRPVPGQTALLRDGLAIPPPTAPPAVRAAIAAGNRIAGRPYRPGGGHLRAEDIGYDCSGAVSYILGSIGALRSPLTSTEFRRFGAPGFGRWITIYAKRGHVFIVIAGLRFDTGWVRGPRGPQWTTRPRPARDFVTRRIPGL